MSWIELAWEVPTEKMDILSSHIFALGALGVQEEYRTGEEPPPKQPWDTEEIVANVAFMILKSWWEITDFEDGQLALANLAQEFEIAPPIQNFVEAEDWANGWKVYFTRKVFSPALAIAPPWEAQEGDVVIEPGIAFGTGEHPTTASCLEALALWAPERAGQTCLDLGCGSGILALAAAKLGMQVMGVDIEATAITSAKNNAHSNGLLADFSQRDVADIHQQFDVVVANLFAEVLVALSQDILRCTKDKLALAGILATKVHMVEEVFQDLTLLRKKQEGDWVSLWYERS